MKPRLLFSGLLLAALALSTGTAVFPAAGGVVAELQPFQRPAVRLTLPPLVYAVPGVETSLYFSNVILARDPAAYRFRVQCRVGKAEGDRWSLNATDADTGDHRLRLQVLGAGGEVAEEAATTVRVVPADAGGRREVALLLVGDSLTHGSVYANETARLLSQPGNPRWTMLGTHKPAGVAAGVAHEGYGGWTWARFVHRYDAANPPTGTSRSSPFVFPAPEGGPAKLDMERYFRESCGGKRPDFITIMLGINDCFGFDPDDPTAIDAGITRMFGEAEALLTSTRQAAPRAEIGICLTTAPNSRDGAFEANYKGRYTRWGWRRIQHRLVERQIAHFGGREGERIYLVPTELNLDPVRGYPEDNAVHPNGAGYRQIGASLYAWLKARLWAQR